MPSRRRPIRSGVVAVVITTLATTALALGTGPAAEAHNYLVSSTPTDGSTVTGLPEQWVITTNDELLDTGLGSGAFALQVRDAAGDYYGDGCVSVTGASMTATAMLGPPGEYELLWQVVSADGHTVSDDLAFIWAPAGAAVASPGRATPPMCGASTAGAEEADDAGAPVLPSPDAAGEEAAPDRPASVASARDAVWIGGAALAVVAAVLLTLRSVRERPRPPRGVRADRRGRR